MNASMIYGKNYPRYEQQEMTPCHVASTCRARPTGNMERKEARPTGMSAVEALARENTSPGADCCKAGLRRDLGNRCNLNGSKRGVWGASVEGMLLQVWALVLVQWRT